MNTAISGSRGTAPLPLCCVMSMALLWAADSSAVATIDPFYAGSYSVTSMPGPTIGEMTTTALVFKSGDPNTLLVGIDIVGGGIYSVSVARGPDQHVTGFGAPTFFASATGIRGGGIDGGLAYGPGGILFYTTLSDNSVGEIKPGSVAPDKETNLTLINVPISVGGLAFAPPGFGGDGHLKLVTTLGNNFWFDVPLSSDGSGTYTLGAAVKGTKLGSAPEGIGYVAAGNAGFPVNSVLISTFGDSRLTAYPTDADGNPLNVPGQIFASGLQNSSGTGAYGETFDPVTGDLLLASGSRIYEIRGFAVPEPESAGLIGLALVALRRRRRSAAAA